MKKLFNKNPKITFEFVETDGGFYLNVKSKGKLKGKHLLGIQEFVERFLREDGKDKRK